MDLLWDATPPPPYKLIKLYSFTSPVICTGECSHVAAPNPRQYPSVTKLIQIIYLYHSLTMKRNVMLSSVCECFLARLHVCTYLQTPLIIVLVLVEWSWSPTSETVWRVTSSPGLWSLEGKASPCSNIQIPEYSLKYKKLIFWDIFSFFLDILWCKVFIYLL